MPEKAIRTPGGYKQSRRPDILCSDPEGKIKAKNIGKTKADGMPVKREVEAQKDLNDKGDTPTGFTPYDQ